MEEINKISAVRTDSMEICELKFRTESVILEKKQDNKEVQS